MSRKEALSKDYLTRNTLRQLHLVPDGSPVAFEENADGSVLFYFDPENIVEADPSLWYHNKADLETMKLESGSVIEKMNAKRAAAFGYYTKEALARIEEFLREIK